MGSCGKWTLQCSICSKPPKIEKHYYNVVDYIKKKKIWAYMTAKYANCRGNLIANSPQCISKYRADLKIRKRKKKIRQKGKEKISIKKSKQGRKYKHRKDL